MFFIAPFTSIAFSDSLTPNRTFSDSRSRQPCKFTGTKDNVYISKEISSTGLAWSINMAAFSLVWFTNMAAVTSMKTLSMWPNFLNEFSLYTLILSTVQFVGFTTDLFSFIIFSSHIVTC